MEQWCEIEGTEANVMKNITLMDHPDERLKDPDVREGEAVMAPWSETHFIGIPYLV